MTIGEKIYRCRKKQNLTQEALAEKLGVSRQSVSKWETGDALPEISKLQPLSEVFGVSVEWLLSEDKEETSEDNKADAYDASSQPEEESTAGKYIWLLGLGVSLFGAFRLVSAIPALISMLSFGGGMPASMVVASVFSVLINVAITAVGIVIIKILRPKSK